MSAVLVSLTDNNHSKVIETVNKTEEEIFRFVKSASHLARALPSKKFFLIDKDLFLSRTKDVVCAILNNERNKYFELSIIEL